MSQNTEPQSTQDWAQFEQARPRLLGLAYRLLGSMAEAEDAVQDTYLKWAAQPKEEIRTPDAWLTTACTNRCLDILKSAQHQRLDYVGPWLPEPLQTSTATTVEDQLALAASLSTAFLLLLERLTPRERAAYLLHEIFDWPYRDLAATLGLKEAACRQLVRRARQAVGDPKTRHQPSKDQQNDLINAFKLAIETGEAGHLSDLLAQDIELHTDGGGKVAAIRKVLTGQERVMLFIRAALESFWKDADIQTLELNGNLGFAEVQNGRIVTVVSFGYRDDTRVSQILITRNPDKLSKITQQVRHDLQTGALHVHDERTVQ